MMVDAVELHKRPDALHAVRSYIFAGVLTHIVIENEQAGSMFSSQRPGALSRRPSTPPRS